MFMTPVSGRSLYPKATPYPKAAAPNLAAPLFAGKKLVSLDYDGTISSDPEHVRTAIEDATPDHVILVNTQRGLTGMRSVGEALGRNVHYIAGGDGVQLYSNPDTRRPADAFIRRLSHSQQPKKWLEFQAKSTNWDHKKVLKIMDRVLDKDVSKLLDQRNAESEKANQPTIQLRRHLPKEALFELRSEQPNREKLQAFGKEVTEQLSKALADQKIKAHVTLQSASNKNLKYAISPEGYDKLSPIEFIMQNHPGGIDEVISAGDGENDLPMLQPKSVFGKKNFSLVCGDSDTVKQTLGEPNHIQYLKNQGLHLGTVLRALITRPSNIRFNVEQNGTPYQHVISGHEFFTHYDKLHRAQKLKYWEMVESVIKDKDSTVRIDSRGSTFMFTKKKYDDNRIRGFTPEMNPLIDVARDEKKWDRRYSNNRFVVIHDLKHKFDEPHFLILPKPLKVGQSGNYENLSHFLKFATDDQKVGLLDTMANLVKSAPNGMPDIKSLFRINSGRYQEIPYLHIHYKPFQRPWEK